MWGSIAAGLQDNGGSGMSDPYSDTNSTKSSWDSLAQNLISGAANLGESYVTRSISGGSVIATGNPLAPTTVIPTVQQATQAAMSRQILTPGIFGGSNGKIVEYVIFGGMALLLGVLVLRR
jgi:hypothetical protein